MKTKTATNGAGVIGQVYIVRDKKHGRSLAGARAIDCDERQHPKRMRLQTGEHAGEVLMLNEFDLIERVQHTEVAGCLAMAWPD